ncbi:hypothetical protein LX36DRAFT_231850 [Colletotrichum falcatum]|nr:hypothetical protein LX36DRAFT_231850 [Colletotrichum falcatum]
MFGHGPPFAGRPMSSPFSLSLSLSISLQCTLYPYRTSYSVHTYILRTSCGRMKLSTHPSASACVQSTQFPWIKIVECVLGNKSSAGTCSVIVSFLGNWRSDGTGLGAWAMRTPTHCRVEQSTFSLGLHCIIRKKLYGPFVVGHIPLPLYSSSPLRMVSNNPMRLAFCLSCLGGPKVGWTLPIRIRRRGAWRSEHAGCGRACQWNKGRGERTSQAHMHVDNVQTQPSPAQPLSALPLVRDNAPYFVRIQSQERIECLT